MGRDVRFLVGVGLAMALAGCGARSTGRSDGGEADSALLAGDGGTAADLDDASDAACTNGWHEGAVGCVGAVACFDAGAECPPLPPCAPVPPHNAGDSAAGDDADTCTPIGGDCTSLPCCPGSFNYCAPLASTGHPTCLYIPMR